MIHPALEEAREAALVPWLDPSGRLRLRGPRHAEAIARRLLDEPAACAALRAACRPLTLGDIATWRERHGIGPDDLAWLDPIRHRIDAFEEQLRRALRSRNESLECGE